MYRQQYPNHPGMHNPPPGASYTRVTYQPNPSFCDRVRSGLLGVIVGSVLIVVASSILFWNEGRAVHTARTLDEGLRVVVPLQSSEVVSVQNEGKLVHLTGPLRTGQLLYDTEYGVTLPAVHLKRVVELFQWVEHERKEKIQEGDATRTETTYSYTAEWREYIIISSGFYDSMNYRNPTEMPVKAREYTAHDAKVGTFSLSPNLLSKVNNFKQFHAQEVPLNLQPVVKLYNGGFYHGIDPYHPVVGDLRVTFEYAGYTGNHLGKPDEVSILARQAGERLTDYVTTEQGTIELLYMGVYSPKKMFGAEQAQNAMLTWALRGGGWLLMFIAFNICTQILVALVDFIPIVRELVLLGTLTMNACLAISLSLTIIALGWIRYRPLLGWTILLCALAPFALSKFNSSRRHRYDSRFD